MEISASESKTQCRIIIFPHLYEYICIYFIQRVTADEISLYAKRREEAKCSPSRWSSIHSMQRFLGIF